MYSNMVDALSRSQTHTVGLPFDVCPGCDISFGSAVCLFGVIVCLFGTDASVFMLTCMYFASLQLAKYISLQARLKEV